MAGPTTSNLATGAVNLVDAAATAVTMGNPDPTRPATNVQLPEIGDSARTLDASSGSLTIDLGAATVIPGPFALAIVKHNLPAAGTVALTFTSGAAGGGSTVLSVGAARADAYGFYAAKIDDQWRNTFLYYSYAASPSFRSLVATFGGTAPAEGFYEVPRAFLGHLILPLYGFPLGANLGSWHDPSERAETPGGNTVYRRKRKWRQVKAELRDLQEAEVFDDFLSTLDATCGKTTDCLVIPYPPDAFPSLAGRLQNRMIWGPQEDTPEQTNRTFQRYFRSVAFRERT
jgi:hypothetical protein